jgi:hypothetical protein
MDTRIWRRFALLAPILALAAWAVVGEARGESGRWLVTVENIPAGVSVPVVSPLSVAIPEGSYVLTSEDGKQTLPGQVFQDDGRAYLGIVLPASSGTSAPATRRYALRAAGESQAEGANRGILLKAEGSNVSISVDGKPFTTLRNDEGPKPFFYPVIGPTGDPYTRAFPMETVEGEDRDHPHQRSFWFTHGSVNGIDFWSELEGHGFIKETAKKTQVGGPVLGRLRTTDQWSGPDGKTVCDDERVVTFFQTPEARVIDFDIVLKATQGPVTFGDTKEGMFGLRVASVLDVSHKKGGKITNAEGVTDDEAWGKASPWVDYTGPLGGKTVGLAILNHPQSFRYPTTWHVRTYGLFAANPFGWHDFGRKESGQYILPRGEQIHFGYRVILHEGDTAHASLPQAFEAYAHPAQVAIAAE